MNKIGKTKEPKCSFPILLRITFHEVLTVSRNIRFQIKCIVGNNTPFHHGKMSGFANAKPIPLPKINQNM